MAKKPIKKFSNGAVEAAVWENERTVKNENVKICSVTLSKRYQDATNAWKSTNSLNVKELPQAISVLQEAYQYLSVKVVDPE